MSSGNHVRISCVSMTTKITDTELKTEANHLLSTTGKYIMLPFIGHIGIQMHRSSILCCTSSCLWVYYRLTMGAAGRQGSLESDNRGRTNFFKHKNSIAAITNNRHVGISTITWGKPILFDLLWICCKACQLLKTNPASGVWAMQQATVSMDL